ncbi:methyltransferase domain-containing protein [Leptospira paudalimensis]|uniref:Class I SAM-dependent methyltransferase n=1 Tax=Leptospira paudalimensis TaxID=2950024 RepID=A0ABT3M6B7_9LEPT|nr:methyltransferase domain-containing protein [Leptospira paudalimensis]MCW7503918.1 class I SAM-dependent methyltransferase [Leptospira paudalimensis]
MTDEIWDSFLPNEYKVLSPYQWTPIEIIRFTWEYLKTDSVTSVMDLGSGVGKFCLNLVQFSNRSFPVYGVEDRKGLVDVSETLRQKMKITGVTFTHSDFLVNFPYGHSHYYVFNPLYEMMKGQHSIDFNKEKSAMFFIKNLQILKNHLSHCKKGTKLITYHGFGGSVLPGYKIVKQKKLEFGDWMVWEKE